jgi:hypothetical protein
MIGVADGRAKIAGGFADPTEEHILAALAHTVHGVETLRSSPTRMAQRTAPRCRSRSGCGAYRPTPTSPACPDRNKSARQQ